MHYTPWNRKQIEHLTDRIKISFSPVLGVYMPEGFAECPTCDTHIIPMCTGPVNGGRLITLSLRCPACDNLIQRDFLEVSPGRTVPFHRRLAVY